MIAAGRRASISATLIVLGTICEYTWHSRTRRAISCAYWAPKSTTRTGLGPVPDSLAICCLTPPTKRPRMRQRGWSRGLERLSLVASAARLPGRVGGRCAHLPGRGGRRRRGGRGGADIGGTDPHPGDP